AIAALTLLVHRAYLDQKPAFFPGARALLVLTPTVEAAARHSEHPTHPLHSKLLTVIDHERVLHGWWGPEKIANAFFRISRSSRTRAFSRCNRRTCSGSGCRWPLPGNSSAI